VFGKPKLTVMFGNGSDAPILRSTAGI